MRATLAGEGGRRPERARPARRRWPSAGLATSHALDLLDAFRRDVTKPRYANWDELMDYCRYSAAPVGRFVLDVHGESRATWPASDALCAALQVINHLQDCGKDRRELDRVYVPQDALAARRRRRRRAGRGRPPRRPCAASSPRLAERDAALLRRPRPLAGQIARPAAAAGGRR